MLKVDDYFNFNISELVSVLNGIIKICHGREDEGPYRVVKVARKYYHIQPMNNFYKDVIRKVPIELVNYYLADETLSRFVRVCTEDEIAKILLNS